MSINKNEAGYRKARELIAKGMTVEAACKSVGVNYGSYYNWRKRNGALLKGQLRVSAPPKDFAPAEGPGYTPGKVILLMGSAHDVISAARGLF